MGAKRILLKITGEVFLAPHAAPHTTPNLAGIIDQIVALRNEGNHFGIVVGGGNFFRGNKDSARLGIKPTTGHTIGMLATMMNGLILADLFEQRNCPVALFTALPCEQAGMVISHLTIQAALKENKLLIFTGGTGAPFFTTDTNAIIRGLQIQADEVWKGTNVDGAYDKDPRTHTDAQLLKRLTHRQALENKIGVMDETAFSLAQQHNMPIRIFNILKPDSLLEVAHDKNIGSMITQNKD